MAEIRHLENRRDVIFFCRGWSDLEKKIKDWRRMTCRLRWCGRNRNQMYNSNMPGEFNGMSSQSHLPHCRVLPPGEFNVMIPELHVTLQDAATEFNGMSSKSHVSHCRVLPLGEFTVVIPVPHATLQGAVTWRNQCYDRTTSQGVRIPPYWKSFFAIFYFF